MTEYQEAALIMTPIFPIEVAKNTIKSQKKRPVKALPVLTVRGMKAHFKTLERIIHLS